MSLSKELCLRSDSKNSHSFSDCLVNKFESKEDNYRRDSFDDRFCDDLCEDVLQYLSLEDKLRLECVSKQFQRTVFQRQYELNINTNGQRDHKNYLKNKEFRNGEDFNYYYIEDQSMDSFKDLLKKCPNITSIEMMGDFGDYRKPDDINAVFQLIIENCNNLKEINFLKDINDSNLKEFHQKFGLKLKCLRYFWASRILIELNRFPNIEKFIIFSEQSFNAMFPELNLAKLKKLRIIIYTGHEHMLQTVIDKFPKLTHFKIVSNSSNENAIYKSLKNISNLKHLIHLECIGINNNFGENNNGFCCLLKQMANNCQNLKSIECPFYIDDTNSGVRQLLSQLKAIPLKRLKFWFYCINNEGEDTIDVNQLFLFELLKGFENITHLSLCLGGQQFLKESILKDIDINLPNLQFLVIYDNFGTTSKGVTQMADILSRLSRLETLRLRFKSGVNFKKIEEQIIEKCRKIRKIDIKTIN